MIRSILVVAALCTVPTLALVNPAAAAAAHNLQNGTNSSNTNDTNMSDGMKQDSAMAPAPMHKHMKKHMKMKKAM